MNHTQKGWMNGMLGVLIFSGSLPATRLAVEDLNPVFLTVCRAAIAGIVAILLLTAYRQKRPQAEDIMSLVIVSLGVVIGFPLLTALALQQMTTSHAIIFVGLLPLATAIFAVIRGGERPHKWFWFFSIIGSLLVGGFAFAQGGHGSWIGNMYMLLSILVCGLGYAEGAKLSNKLGHWQVICWALTISLPMMVVLSFWLRPTNWHDIGYPAWLSLGYVSLFSMLIGFIFWYRGLAQGGIAAVGQLQLLQPFFGLLLAALLIHEHIGIMLILVNIAVVGCVMAAKRFA